MNYDFLEHMPRNWYRHSPGVVYVSKVSHVCIKATEVRRPLGVKKDQEADAGRRSVPKVTSWGEAKVALSLTLYTSAPS